MRLVLAAALILLAGPLRSEPLEARWVATGAPIADDAALVAALEGADVVVIGEIHDNPAHQALQARLIRVLAPTGVAFEMVPQADTDAVNAALAAGDLSAFPNLAPYDAPLRATPPGRVFGAGQPRERIVAAMRSTAAEAFDGDAARFGLTTPFPPEEQAAIKAELFASHCDALPEEMLPGMAEAQRLRDAAFAAAALRARDGGGTAVLIAGNGHVRTDRGVPFVLRTAAPELKVVAIAQIERADSAERAPDPPYDIVIETDPAPREDPCAQFRKE